MSIEQARHYFFLTGNGNNRTSLENVSDCLAVKLVTKVIDSLDDIVQVKKSIGAIGYVMNGQSEQHNANLKQLQKILPDTPKYIFTLQISIPLLHYVLRLGFNDVFQLPMDQRQLVKLAAQLKELNNLDCFHQDPKADKSMLSCAPLLSPALTQELSHPLETLFNLIEQHYVNAPSLQQVADKLFLSPSRISHMFKDLSGIGYLQYILCRRLEQSEYLLRLKYSDITNISYRVGFSNPSHFCRNFKQHIGITPTAYLKNETGIELSPLYRRYQKLRMECLPVFESEQVALEQADGKKLKAQQTFNVE